MARKGGDPYATNKNFIFENMEEAEKYDRPEQKQIKIAKKMQLLKER